MKGATARRRKTKLPGIKLYDDYIIYLFGLMFSPSLVHCSMLLTFYTPETCARHSCIHILLNTDFPPFSFFCIALLYLSSRRPSTPENYTNGSNGTEHLLTPSEWDISKHWLAITSILLIVGAAGVAVPLALRVSSGQYA